MGTSNTYPTVSGIFREVCSERREVDPLTLKEVLTLATEIAREGREGRRIGTMFVVGDTEAVMARSRPLVLDPLYGHSDESKRIDDSWARESFKEFAQLDGAFIVRDDGVVVSAGRYIESLVRDIDLPTGLGTRHLAGASITATTKAVAAVVSESAVVRVFDDGEIISEIVPELWILERYGWGFLGPDAEQRTEGGTTVFRKTE